MHQPLTPDRPRTPGRGFGVLRHRDFRLYWVGAVISFLGIWMEMVARNWLLFEMSNSALVVGLNGLFMTIPFVLTSLYAGTVVDRVDRRRLLIWIELLNLSIFFALATLVITGRVEVWHIYATSLLHALVGAFESPTRSSLLPYLVPRDELVAAVSLSSVVRRGTQIIGPALGGIAVATLGVGGTYVLTAAIYGFLPAAIVLMRTTNPPAERTTQKPFQALTEGIRYVRSDPVLGPILLLEAFMSSFGFFSPLMVVFARTVFDVGAEGLGLLQSAVGLGSVIGSLGLATVGDVRHKGRVMIAAGVLFGVSVAAFAPCPWFVIALPILAVVGAADMRMGTLRVTVIQLVVRGPLRGRVMSLQAIATRGLSPFGGFQLGALAQVTGVQSAVALGAIVCAAASLFVAWRAPAVRSFTDSPTEPPTERERGAAASG